jgi:hypothetical protein
VAIINTGDEKAPVTPITVSYTFVSSLDKQKTPHATAHFISHIWDSLTDEQRANIDTIVLETDNCAAQCVKESWQSRSFSLIPPDISALPHTVAGSSAGGHGKR